MRKNQKNFGISNQVRHYERKNLAQEIDAQSNIQEQSSNAFDMQQMLADSGLQVHPKQQQDLMKNSKLQKMLHDQANPDPQLQQILKRATDTQKGIQNTIQNLNQAPAYADSVSERELDMELQRKIEKIMMGRGDQQKKEEPTPYQLIQSTSPTQKKIDSEFQQILDDQIAQKIAQEISKKITISYDDVKSRQSTGRASTKKQVNSNLRMGTFSSNQKNVQTTPKLAPRKLEKRVERTIDFTPPYYGGSDNRSNTFIEDDVPIQRINKTFTQKKQVQKIQIDRQPVLGPKRTPITALKPTYKKSGTISQNSSVGRLSAAQPRNRQQKYQKMRDEKRATVAPKISPIEKLNESQKLQKRIEEQANELTERMKQMSVYDLYTMNNQNRDNILIDTLIKKQLMERGSLQPTESPGVAPQVMPLGNDGNLVGPSVNEISNAQIFQNGKNSIIIETVDEHLQSLSMTPSPQFAQNKINMQKALQRSSMESLQAAKLQNDNMRISVNLSPQITERNQQKEIMYTGNAYKSPRGTNRQSSVEEPQSLKVRQEFQTPGKNDNMPIDSYRSIELISTSQPLNRNSDPTQKVFRQESDKRFNTANRSRRKKGSLHSDHYFESMKKRYNGISRSSMGLLSAKKASTSIQKDIPVSNSFIQKKLSTPAKSKHDSTPSKRRLDDIRQGFAEYKNSFKTPDAPTEEKPIAPTEIQNQMWQKLTEKKDQNDYSNPFKNLFYNQSTTKNQEDRINALQLKYSESPDKAPAERVRRDRSQRSQGSNKQSTQKVENNLFEVMINKRLNKDEGKPQGSFVENDYEQENQMQVEERFKPFHHQKLVNNNRPLETPDFTMDIQKQVPRVKSKSPATYHTNKLNKSGEFKNTNNLVINVNTKTFGRPKSSNIYRSGGVQQNRIKYTRVKELTPYSDMSQKSTGKVMDLTQPILKQKSITTAGTTKKSYRVPIAKSSYINSKKPTQLVSELLTPTSPQSPESSKKPTDTMDLDIKNFRLQAQDSLQLINLIALNEIDSVKKPQRYMYFICKLFKMMFDLITNSNNFMTNQIRKHKKDDGVTSDISMDKSDVPYAVADPSLFQKVKDKYFVTFDTEVKYLKQILQFEKEIVEKETQTEWNSVLKPFLLQNSLQFQKNVQGMCKNLKKIIETNLKDQLNLQLLRQFAETIKDILKINQSLTNQCMKQNGNIYSKFYEAINSCCQYTVKKCTKEIEKLRGEDDHRDEDQEELEKDTRQQPLEDEVGRVKDFQATLLLPQVQDLRQNNFQVEEEKKSQKSKNNQQYTDQTQEEDQGNHNKSSYRSIQHIIAQRSNSQEAKDSLQDQIQEEIEKMKIRRDKSRELFQAETKVYSRMDPSEMIRTNMNHQQIFEYSPPKNQPKPVPASRFKINLVPIDKDSEMSLLSDRDDPKQAYNKIPTPSQQSSQREAGGRRSRQSRRSANSNSKSANRKRIHTPNQYMMKSPSLVEIEKQSRPVTPKELENQPLIKQKTPRVIEDMNDHDESAKMSDNAMMKLQKMEAQTEETQMNANNILSDDRNEEDVVDSEINENQHDIVDIVFDNSRASYQNEGKIGYNPNFEVKNMVATMQEMATLDEDVPLPQSAVPTPMEVEAKTLQLEMIDQLNQEMQVIYDNNVENAYENFKKMKENMPKISKAFQREYGLYNPDHGIIPYYFDPEYTDPNEPEDFFISLQKIKQPKIKNLEEAKSPLQQYITKKTPDRKMMPSSQYHNPAYNTTKSSAKKNVKKRVAPNMDDSGYLLRSPIQNQRVNSRNVDQKI